MTVPSRCGRAKLIVGRRARHTRERAQTRRARTERGVSSGARVPTTWSARAPRRADRPAGSVAGRAGRTRAPGAGRPRARAASTASRATSGAAPFPRLDDSDDCSDEVVGRRHLADVDTCPEGGRPQLRLAVLAGSPQPAPNSSSLESTVSCSPVSASSTTMALASGSSYSRGSTSRMATTSCRSLSRSRGRSHPGPVMKSETRTTSDRRRIVRSAVSSSRVRSVTAPFVSGGGRRRLRVSASTWFRLLLRGGSVSSSLVVEQDGPDPVAAPGEKPCEGGRELAQDELLRPVDRPEAHRTRSVEQQPCGELAVLRVLADERGVHPRRHVPVDVPDVVPRLVLAKVEEVHSRPAKHRPVVPLQDAVETTHDLPLEPVQELLGRRRAERARGVRGAHVSGASGGHALAERARTGTAARTRSITVSASIRLRAPGTTARGGDGARRVRSPGGPARARTRVPERAPGGRRGSC